jgi:hypothetical protein
MSTIERVTMYRYRGQTYPTAEKAIDMAENFVGECIKQDLFDRGFTVSDWVKIVEVILANRSALRELLDYDLEGDDGPR